MQTRLDSFKEAISNAFISYIVAVLFTFFINWLHDVDIPVWKNFSMTFCFTVLSIIRSYFVRRWFNKKEINFNPLHNDFLFKRIKEQENYIYAKVKESFLYEEDSYEYKRCMECVSQSESQLNYYKSLFKNS
jgi:hypothetical protein